MNLLLIMPNFFDYPQVISEELVRMGYNVDFFDDRPSTNAWIKAVIRFNPNIISSYINNYFNRIMHTIGSKTYDVFFLISGQSLSLNAEMIGQIKIAHPNAKFVLYQWDSMQNFPRIEIVKQFFEKVYSFDRRDCDTYPNLKFLPLFYCRRYEEIGRKKITNYKYDFCFVGTAHPKKYKFINMMSMQLKSIYPKQFIYFFLPSPIVYFYRRLKNPELKTSHYNEFHYIPLKGKEMDQLFLESRCVLDSPQDGQLGLTIRVIEALGAKKKLITTNADVKNYDFYKEENIYVYDGNIDMNNVFFKKPYVEVDKDVYEKYSLRKWLEEILS